MRRRRSSVRVGCSIATRIDASTREGNRSVWRRISTNAVGDEMAPNCTVEDPCTNDVLRAALAGVQGLTTADKLEALGKDSDAVNSTSRYAIFD